MAWINVKESRDVRNCRSVALGVFACSLLFVSSCSSSSGGSGQGGDTGDTATEDSAVDVSTLEDAYSEGFLDACADVWSNSPDGDLYYEDVAYTQDDCEAELDEAAPDTLSDPDEARDQGQSDGYDAAFDLPPTGELCYAQDCYTRADF